MMAGIDVHLDEKGLSLAARRVGVPDEGSSHDCRDIGDGVAERGIEHEPVDRFVEGFGHGKCHNDE